jgi:hypothetical protein
VSISFGDVHELALKSLGQHVHNLRRDFPYLRILLALARFSGSNRIAWTNPWINGTENSLKPGEAFHDVSLERVRYGSPHRKCNQWCELLQICGATASKELIE